MAFGTIGWNGVGSIETCENDTGWNEQGGGTYGYNPDQYLQGAASMGNQYASKSGYTYYTHGSTFNFSTTHAGQRLYIWISVASTSAVNTLANDGMSVILGSDYSNNRHWIVAGSDDDNGWAQGWKLFVIDPTTSGSSDTGTYAQTTVDTFGLWIDAIVSVRAQTIFIDEFAIADGMICHSGAGTFDQLVTYCWGTPATRLIGVITENGRFNYLVDKLTVGDSTNATADTTLTVTDKVIGFNVSEYYSGSAWTPAAKSTSLYNIVNLEKHASYATTLKSVNSSWYGNENAWLSFTKDSGASYEFDGGTIEKIKAFTVDSDWTIENVNLNDVEAVTVNGGTFDGNTVSSSKKFTISSTINNCTFKNGTEASSTSTTDLTYLNECAFESDGSNYAVDLGTISVDDSMTWNNTLTGYATSNGSTGNEAILVNVASGKTLTINMTGGTTPTYNNTGTGTVTVAASVTIEVKNVISGSAVHMATVDGNGDESTVLLNEFASGTSVSDSVNYAGLDYTAVTIAVRSSSGTPRYLPYKASDTISADGLSHSANQQEDTLAN